jgi:EmrB/QacA subfamily drug resistance transporter
MEKGVLPAPELRFKAFPLDPRAFFVFPTAMAPAENPQTIHREYSPSMKGYALLIATLTSFSTPFMGSSINVALPAIQKTFDMNAVLLSWVATSYLLSAAIFLVPFGRLADIHGRKKIFACGIVTFTLASLVCGLSTSGVMLLVFRVIQGFGSAMIFATGIAIISSVYPPRERGRALGINVAATYTGLSLGPLLGGLLTQHLTWRSVFFFNVPFGIAIIWMVVAKLKAEWAEGKGERFDIQGAFFYGMGLAGIMYGISRLPGISSMLLILVGFSGMVGFVLWELRVEQPVFNLSLLARNRPFAFSCLAALIHYSATFAITFLLSLYLQYIRGMTPQEAGFVLVAQPVMMALLSPFAGRLSDRVEPRVVASAGMGLTTVGITLFLFLREDTPIHLIVGILLLIGIGYGLFSSPNMNAIMGAVDKRFYGLASGSVGTMRLLGMMISMAIATVIFTLLLGRVQITPERYPSFLQCIRISLSVFSVLCFAGIFSSLARGDIRGTPS